MSSEVAIHCEGLSKRYRIGEQERYKALRDVLSDAATAPFRRLRHAISRNGSGDSNSATRNSNPEIQFRNPQSAIRNSHIWALDDVSFEVKRGEVVGIIGRNGAGKSTLLKILSRITKPTKGHAEIHGRVGSLLEVGTGFHPELTGRENIYLNGAILGMRKGEIDRKFDEIVAFAEVEKFIDTPVKRFSSGMYVRLAFAVAAHMETDILLVDEALAVGDAAFQKKCLNAMQEVGSRGRTVLFVSHNMSAIMRLCDRVLLVSKGALAADGPSHSVVKQYLDANLGMMAVQEWNNPQRAPGNHVVRLCSARVCTEDGEPAEVFDIRRPLKVEVIYEVLKPCQLLIPNFHFFNSRGLCLFAVQDTVTEWRHRTREIGKYLSSAWIPGNFLAEGHHIIELAISSHVPNSVVHLYARNALAFRVVDSNQGDSARGDFTGHMPGVVRPIVKWTTEPFVRKLATCDSPAPTQASE